MKLMIQGEIQTILFARICNGQKSHPNKFIYCGALEVESYDTAANISRPFGVKFRTLEIPKEIGPELQDLIKKGFFLERVNNRRYTFLFRNSNFNDAGNLNSSSI